MKQATNELRMLQIKEAVERMKQLKLLQHVIDRFEKRGLVLKSENFRLGGNENRIPILYELSDNELAWVKEWEKKTGNVVYHIIQNRMEFGLCYSFLYVSTHMDEWEYDCADLVEGYPLVYVLNADIPHFSEYGSIGIKPLYGAVLRTA